MYFGKWRPCGGGGGGGDSLTFMTFNCGGERSRFWSLFLLAVSPVEYYVSILRFTFVSLS